jgi:hypothetical protein
LGCCSKAMIQSICKLSKRNETTTCPVGRSGDKGDKREHIGPNKPGIVLQGWHVKPFGSCNIVSTCCIVDIQDLDTGEAIDPRDRYFLDTGAFPSDSGQRSLIARPIFGRFVVAGWCHQRVAAWSNITSDAQVLRWLGSKKFSHFRAYYK